MGRVNTICSKIISLTEIDFKEATDLAESQVNYLHPLKHAKQSKINKTGKNNLKVIELLKQLKAIIEQGK